MNFEKIVNDWFARLHDATPPVAAGWKHLMKVGDRRFEYCTQVDGVGSEDIYVFEIAVSRKGRIMCRLLNVEPEFGVMTDTQF